MPTSTLTKITTTEAKLMLRDGANVFFSVIFPTALMVALAFLIPGFREPAEDLEGRYAGLSAAELYAPVVLALAIATVSITIVPTYLATYREQGVLRRLATTPASPRDLLSAQLIVNLALLAIGSTLALLAAIFVVDVSAPANFASLVIAFVLGTVATMAVGLVIAAVAPTAKATTAIAMSVYFPMLFFAGVWTPGPAMPDAIRAVADFSPVGAAAEAMTDAWFGDWPSLLHVAVMVGWAVVGGFVAAKLFRWE